MIDSISSDVGIFFEIWHAKGSTTIGTIDKNIEATAIGSRSALKRNVKLYDPLRNAIKAKAFQVFFVHCRCIRQLFQAFGINNGKAIADVSKSQGAEK